MSASASFFKNVLLSELVLRVRNFEHVRRFYESALGMITVDSQPGQVSLGYASEGPALVVLVNAPDAAPRPHDAAGLFHVAFLHPTRRSLGRAARRLVEQQVDFGGGDHGVSEALYLSDPEGNGIELYVDRPISEWPTSKGGDVAMYTEEVNIGSILQEGEKDPVVSDPIRIGHIHLSVADLDPIEQLLVRGLGFAVRQRNYPGALFFGRDGYHHHFGANTWKSRRGAPRGCVGLDRFTISLSPEPAELVASLRQLGVFTDATCPDPLVFRTGDGIGFCVTGLADEAG